ncbi:MAG: hypothetical protein JO164_08150 [Candidatus Eremiobacteraeota bacterium]|nr:hypothetical protein [Candidatus Eremiobacteraeota bacterium]
MFALALLGAASAPRVVANAHPFADAPGPPPAVDARDYEPYAGTGSSTLVVQLVVRFSDGTVAPTTQGGLTFAYPDTPFTRWLLHAYCARIDGATLMQGMAYPGDVRTGLRIPRYLNPILAVSDPAHAVVKIASNCTDNGVCTFAQIPPGRYLVISSHWFSRATVDQAVTVTPGGDPDTGYTLDVRTSDVPTERPVFGYTMAGGHFTVAPDRTAYGKPDALPVRAAYRIDRTH